MANRVLKIRFVLFSALGLTVLLLLHKAVVPFGEITYQVTPCDNSFFVQKLKPTDRLGPVNPKTCTQKITGEPAYFNLNTQRTFDRAAVTLTYQTSGHNNIIELGVQQDERKNYRLQPLYNQTLDSLDWDIIEENGVYLLQRERNYDSVEEFLDKVANINKSAVLTYHYNLPTQTVITDYEPSQEHTIISQQLRGSYQFYTYVTGETAEFEVLFSDLNQNKDTDDVRITLYDANNQPVVERIAADERGGEETRRRQEAGGLHLELTTLTPGFYKVSVATTDDTITEQIFASQKIMSFTNRLWLAESSDTDLITLYTDVSEVTAATLNPQALQKIMAGNEVLYLNETYRQFSLPTEDEVTKIQFAKNDVILSGSGVFAFSKAALYNPNYKKFSKNQNLDGVNYIVTTYPPAASQLGGQAQPQAADDGWQTITLTFDLKNTFRYENNYGFIISVPGLIAGDDIDDYVEIKDIMVELKGRTLMEKIKEKLGN